MSDWNKALPDFKAKRRGEVELRPVGGSKKKLSRKWHVVGTFAGKEYIKYRGITEAVCAAWVEKQGRTFYCHRNASQAEINAAKQRQLDRVSLYRIVGPTLSSAGS